MKSEKMHGQSSELNKKRRISTLVTLICVVVSLLGMVLISTPHGLIRDKATVEAISQINRLFPQGWGFFTRNPREDSLELYAKEANGEWVSNIRGTAVSLSSVGGWNRDHRATEYDIQNLIQGVDGTWHECSRQVTALECFDDAEIFMLSPAQEKNLHSHLKTFCEIALVRQPPIPFEYSDLNYLPIKNVIRIGTSCSMQESL